jgi:hypothetical protein
VRSQNDPRPTPEPRYSRPATSCGRADSINPLASGVLSPKSAAAPNARGIPRRMGALSAACALPELSPIGSHPMFFAERVPGQVDEDCFTGNPSLRTGAPGIPLIPVAPKADGRSSGPGPHANASGCACPGLSSSPGTLIPSAVRMPRLPSRPDGQAYPLCFAPRWPKAHSSATVP